MDQNGRYTGTTDLELTPAGMNQVTASGSQLVGPHKLIEPSRLAHVWVSPRKRALQTYHLLFGNADRGSDMPGNVTVTEDIAEWDYGDYEGLLVGEIRAGRKEKGLDREREWNIWRDGCEGGEYVTLPCAAQCPALVVRYRNEEEVADRRVCCLGRRLRSSRGWIA